MVRDLIAGAGIVTIALLTGSCEDGRLSTMSAELDRDTLRIVCRIEGVEADFFAEAPPDTPLRRQMESFRSGSDASVRTAGSVPQAIVGYPQTFSISQGEKAEIRFSGELVRVGDRLTVAEVFDGHDHVSLLVADYGDAGPSLRREVCTSWYSGCNFTSSVALDTDQLPSGLYYVFLTDNMGAKSAPIYFHVRPTPREVQSADVIVLMSELTWYAYNFYGGGSLYGIHRVDENGGVFIDQDPQSRLYAASMQRPLLSDPTGARPSFTSKADARDYYRDHAAENLAVIGDVHPRMLGWTRTSPESHLPTSRYLRAEGLKTVTLAQTDLEADPDLLEGARLVLVTGHNEYWTDRMFRAFEEYVRDGGLVANFSGNVAWWQINLIEGTIYQDQLGHRRTSACLRQLPEHFRHTGLRDQLADYATDNLFGVSYRFANFPVTYPQMLLSVIFSALDFSTIDLGAGMGVVVKQPEHPIFDGLDLEAGERLGAGTAVLAVELDGVPLDGDGEIDRSFINRLPTQTDVLATGLAFVENELPHPARSEPYSGIKSVGLVTEARPFDGENGARVISFGSIGYSNMIAAGDRRFQRLLLNTINYLYGSRESDGVLVDGDMQGALSP